MPKEQDTIKKISKSFSHQVSSLLNWRLVHPQLRGCPYPHPLVPTWEVKYKKKILKRCTWSWWSYTEMKFPPAQPVQKSDYKTDVRNEPCCCNCTVLFLRLIYGHFCRALGDCRTHIPTFTCTKTQHWIVTAMFFILYKWSWSLVIQQTGHITARRFSYSL